MKKLFGLIGVVGCAVAAVSTPALARDDWNFYVGGDYQYLSPSWKTAAAKQVLPKNLANGIDAHVGVGFLSNYAVELGYMQSSANRDVIISGTPVSTKAQIGGPTLDFLGYLPFGRTGIYGIGTVGISDLEGKAKIDIGTGPVSTSKTEFGYRGGVGIEWRPIPRFGVRALVRYQSADFDDVAKHAIVANVGLNIYL